MLWATVRDKPVESGWGAATLLVGVLIYLFSRKEQHEGDGPASSESPPPASPS